MRTFHAHADHLASAAPVQYVSTSETVSSRPDLASAGKVVSGGRALNTKENFGKYIEPLADALGAGKWIPNVRHRVLGSQI